MEKHGIIKILLADFASEKLKLEEELEEVLNSNLNVGKKIKTIKKLLNKIVKNESMTVKFASYLKQPINKTKKELLTDDRK